MRVLGKSTKRGSVKGFDFPLITLTSDFGYKDSFAGVMKGVILEINPKANIVDLSHGVSPQNVREGAFVLFSSYRYFRNGAIHLVVIDPKVGSKRKAIAVKTKDHIFVGPDNGVLSWAVDENKMVSAVEITKDDFITDETSHTFHGRDIFAPAAAHLSLGVPIGELGPGIENIFSIEFPRPNISDSEIRGEVLYVDQFGNLITNIPKKFEEKIKEVRIDEIKIGGISVSYSDVGIGELVAVFGSSGYLEIAKNQGSAKDALDIDVGNEVRVIF